MDILAHMLWTNLAFQQASDETRFLAVALSIGPDLTAFVPAIGYSIFKNKGKDLRERPSDANFEKINKATPWWVFRLYDISHGIPIWMALTSIWWLLAGAIPLAALGWLGHIVVDIPTHSRRFFPTPFLWPISKFNVDGVNWSTPWFMAVNYGSLILLYAAFAIFGSLKLL